MIDLSQKNWIIFDLDGTIAKLGVDWPACRTEARGILVEKYPKLKDVFDIEEKKLQKQNRSLTIEIMGTIAYDALGYDVYESFQSIQERHEISCTIKDTGSYEKIVDFIKNNSKNYKFAVCSNNSLVGIEHALKLLSLRQYFSIIESRKIGRPPKPHPAIMKDLLSLAGAKTSECLYVGDNIFTDEKLAIDIGIDYLDYKDFINQYY